MNEYEYLKEKVAKERKEQKANDIQLKAVDQVLKDLEILLDSNKKYIDTLLTCKNEYGNGYKACAWYIYQWIEMESKKVHENYNKRKENYEKDLNALAELKAKELNKKD